MAEYLTVEGSGADYEAALAECFVQVKNVCGNEFAQVHRTVPPDDTIPLQDWVLDITEARISLGRTTVGVEATFYLLGSDE